jgi:type VI secretion system secreted protein VgrG
MKDGSITLGGPFDLFIKTITVQKQGKATLNMPLDLNHPALAGMPTTPLTFYAGASPASRAAIPANMPYSLFAGGTLVKQGVMDETSLLQVEHHPTTQQYTLKLANGASYTIPVADQYRGNADNGALANGGFHFYEGQSGTNAGAVDRAQHRADYDELLNPETDA